MFLAFFLSCFTSFYVFEALFLCFCKRLFLRLFLLFFCKIKFKKLKKFKNFLKIILIKKPLPFLFFKKSRRTLFSFYSHHHHHLSALMHCSALSRSYSIEFPTHKFSFKFSVLFCLLRYVHTRISYQ